MKIKYFLRGLGFGILITTLLLLGYLSKNNSSTMTDEQVIERAKELGMLTEEEVKDYRLDESLDNLKESLNVSESPEVTEKATVSMSPEPSAVSADESKANESNKGSDSLEKEKDNSKEILEENEKNKVKEKKPETITVRIKSGLISESIAQYLYEKKVIESAEDFKEYLIKNKETTSIIAGTYQIPVDATYEEIVEIITERKK